MRQGNFGQSQRGVALVVSLIFLLVITIMSVVAATNSRQGLTMTSNLQDSYDSFHAAEAGVLAAIATAGTATDEFTGSDNPNIFGDFDADEGPLGHLTDGNAAMTVNIFMTNFDGACPASAITASSTEEFSCDYYRVESTHEVARKATTKVSQGVIKTTIGVN
jgi:hypothetical protein